MTKKKDVNICGVRIDNVEMSDIIVKVDSYIKERRFSYIVTPNADHIVKLQRDPEFGKIYGEAALVLADGMPLLWAARFLGTPLKEKISGSDLFPRLCGLAAEIGYKLFFLGGRKGAAVKAAEVLRNKSPAIKIVGCYSPPLGFENDPKENGKIIKMIRDAKPDILFVGLGAPKQEKWIYRYKGEYQVPVSVGVGASFEFTSGMVKRAPRWMQKRGLEWFWRLMMEPGKLWKRYLIDDMQFFWLVARQKLGSRER